MGMRAGIGVWDGMEGFARRVERVRRIMGCGVEAFAEAYAIDPAQVRDWERGLAPADERIRDEILGALSGMDPGRLAQAMANARPRTLH